MGLRERAGRGSRWGRRAGHDHPAGKTAGAGVTPGAALGAVTLVFIAAGVGLFLRLPWWRDLTVITAIASSIVFFLVWDGRFNLLPNKGFVGIGLNIVLLLLVLVFELPVLG